MFALQSIPRTSVIALKFSLNSLNFRIRYLVTTQISVHESFIFERSNNSIVPNKQPWNSKTDGLFIAFIIKFVIMIFVILSRYWEHYPNRVNDAIFFLSVLKCPPPPTSHPCWTWVKSLTLSHSLQKSKTQSSIGT